MLIDDVLAICRRLSDEWKTMLGRHGLDLSTAVLDSRERFEEILTYAPLTVDRDIRGFEDFALDRARAIAAGKPAQSLLYHALASPAVFTRRTSLAEKLSLGVARRSMK